MALAYNSVTNTYSAGAVTSFGAVINSNVNAVYVAILFGNSASSDFTSIVQTNVKWSFQCWVQNINGAGRSAEVWVGIPTGTPGTSATINNNASCQMGIVCYSFTGVPTPLRADLLETVNISQHAGNQVVWQNIGTSPNNVAYLQACFIISPSGTAITTGATSYINYGSQPFGCGAAYTLYTSGTYVSGGIWSENSSYQMINVQVVLKGYTAPMQMILAATTPAYSTNNIVAAATAPWNFTPSNGQMWSQLSQVILGIQYWSSALTDSANPTSTGMSFTRLANCTAIQVTAGHYIHLEIWVGYSSIGACPLPVGGSPTLTLTPASGLSQTYVNVVVINMTGMDVVSKVLENATFYHVENNASGNTYTVPGVVNNVTGDLGVMFVSQSANSASYFNYYYSNPTPTTPYSNGPCLLGCASLTAGAGTNSVYITNGSGTISAWWEALVVILKAPGANVNSKNFVESISMSDTIQKTVARTYATETGIQAVIADTCVRTRMPGGPRTYTESIITMVDRGIVKTPAKNFPKEVFTITETFAKVHYPGGPQTFSEVITLADLGFNWHGSFHPTFTDAFTLADGGITPVLKHVANLTDTFTLAELFDSVHKQFTSFADALTLSDISSLTHDQELEFLEVFSLSDSISETYAQFLEVAEAFTLSDVFAEFHKAQITFTDVITLLESLVNVYTPGGGGGPIPVLATGALTGSSAAAAVVAALIFATALGNGRVTGLAGVAYQVATLLRGWCFQNGLAGQSIAETGAAAGGSSASGIEGAQLVVVGGSTEGDGSTQSDTCLWTAQTAEADGVSPEMDCDTQCIFLAEGNTMPDTAGSAVAAATYALLHLIATLRGASLAVAQVYSPVVASGACEGDGSAQYVSIALYDSEAVVGESEAVGMAGCLFHGAGDCDPIRASNASGTANYGPGRIAGFVGGRGVVAGVPTVLPA